MKKIFMALVASLTLGFAGGNIAPVASVVDESPLAGLYIGGGLGSTWTYDTGDFDFSSDTDKSVVDPAIGLRVGYDFYKNSGFVVGAEGRIVASFDANDFDTTVYSLYLKPGYEFEGTGFGVYGLAGYSWTRWDAGEDSINTDGFSFGLGAEYSFTKHLSVAVDWTSNVWDDSISDVDGKNINNDVVMVWVNYKF